MPLVGYEGYLLFSETVITKYPADSLVAEAGAFNEAALKAGLIDIDDAIDVSPDSSTEKTTTTSRKLARKGKKGEKSISSSGTISFGVSNELISDADTMLYKLVNAGTKNQRITLFDLNGSPDEVGAWGTVGVYELNKPSAPKTLSGHQVLAFEATLQDWPSDVVVVDDGGTLKFIDLDDLATFLAP